MAKTALIFGANSAIAQAMIPLLRDDMYRVIGVARRISESPGTDQSIECDYSEAQLAKVMERLEQAGEPIDLLLSFVGVLHWQDRMPEKKLADLNTEQLRDYFAINTIVPALILKYSIPLMNRKSVSRAVILSAKIAGTSDNRLGGWYGYRASKAALNSIVKTASIELRRTHPKTCLIALHPGTTDTPLSKPFSKKLPENKLFNPEQSAKRLKSVIDELQPEDSGRFVHWDGSDLPW